MSSIRWGTLLKLKSLLVGQRIICQQTLSLSSNMQSNISSNKEDRISTASERTSPYRKRTGKLNRIIGPQRMSTA